MSRQSSSVPARSSRGDRVLVSLIGLLLLAAGVFALVLAQGWLGADRAGRTVVDPVAAHGISGHPLPVLVGGILGGLVLLALGLAWFARSVRPQRRPDLMLDTDLDFRVLLTSGAICEAVRADCERLSGVNRARVRTVGSAEWPAMRMNLWLDEGTDVRGVWSEMESGVLPRLRQSIEGQRLPVGVRVELDSAPPPRVR
jgi:hypothetical protein